MDWNGMGVAVDLISQSILATLTANMVWIIVDIYAFITD